MTWSRTKLEQVAGERLAKRGRLEPVEQAALAYARWQGLTDEADVDTDAAKWALDRALSKLDAEPDGWLGLKELADDLGDAAIIGLMQHSLQRGVEQVRAMAHEPEEGIEAPPPPPHRKRGKDKGM